MSASANAPAGAAAPSRRAMFTLEWWMLPVVTASAFLLRLVNVGRVVNFLDDRYINAPGALNYLAHGMPGPDNWFTQPAKHLSMWVSIALLGNDPYAWSMRQVVMGTLVVVLTFLLARRVFRAQFPAWLAAAVVALDPAWVVFSRAGSEDPSAVVFILAALLYWVRAVQEEDDWAMVAAGTFIGVATATRWYAGLVAAVLLGVTLVARRGRGGAEVAKVAGLLGAVPIAAYLVPFLPWVARGNTLADLWSYQVDAFLVQQTGAYPTFDAALAPLTGPSGWFTRWMAVSTTQSLSGGSGAFTVMMNDPVVWWMFVPAIAFVCWSAWRRRLPEYWALGLSFLVLLAFFWSVDRPIYVYSALCLVPLGAAAVGYASGRLMKRWSLALLVAVVVWGAYLYPLTSSVAVPLAAYAWLLRVLGVPGVG